MNPDDIALIINPRVRRLLAQARRCALPMSKEPDQNEGWCYVVQLPGVERSLTIYPVGDHGARVMYGDDDAEWTQLDQFAAMKMIMESGPS